MKKWSDADLQQLRVASNRWFKKHGRVLPWRLTHDPYKIWISEIMLQQTQVSTVIPYFERFLDEFPTVTTLAEATEERVFFHWAGLGYYRRAKQLHAAAKVVVEKHGGCFPSDFNEILALPGIGRYTAGAIASFAYDDRQPIVEANTQRLFARLIALEEPTSLSTSQAQLWSFAESILPPRKGSGALNQSVMEIGSQVCLPREPRCDECPLQSLCPTCEHSLQKTIPAPKPPKVYEERTEVAFIVRDPDRGYLIRRCEDGERWAGLWDFPRLDASGEESDSIDQIVHAFGDRYGEQLHNYHQAMTLKHGVTKYRITLHCIEAELSARSDKSKRSTQAHNLVWRSLAELKTLPLNSTAKQILKSIAPPVG